MFLSTLLKSRATTRQLATVATQVMTPATQGVRLFSTPQPTAEELAQKREEWGEKYSDECFAFEKEWEAISKKIEQEYAYIIH
jgi:hypothetical protein